MNLYKSIFVSLFATFSLNLSPVFAQDNLNLAIQLYQRGNYQEAAQLWESLIQDFKLKNDSLNQAMALSNLSLTYQKLGDWEKAKSSLNSSLNLLSFSPQTPSEKQILAQTLAIQGNLYLQLGNNEQAIETWQKSSALYEDLKETEKVQKNNLNQVIALQNLGFYTRSCQTLLNVLKLDDNECKLSPVYLEKLSGEFSKLNETEKKALITLGNIFRVTGDLKQSELLLETILKQDEKNLNLALKNQTLINLGNTQQILALKNDELRESDTAKKYQEAALTSFNNAKNNLDSPLEKTQVNLNILKILLLQNNWNNAQEISLEIEESLPKLIINSETINAKINFAKNLFCLQEKNNQCIDNDKKVTERSEHQKVLNLLESAVKNSQLIENKKIESYSWGTLGELYAKFGQQEKAKQYLEIALKNAQEINADDIAYQWYWQLGKLYKEENIDLATSYYLQAFTILNNIKGDLVALNPEIQFSFRQSIEPVYREYAQLLLSQDKNNQKNLKQTREVIEALQIAELNNFFRDNCLQAKPVNIDNLDPKSAIFYTIILPESLEVIVAIPGEPLVNYSTEISATKLREKITDTKIGITGDLNTRGARSIEVIPNTLNTEDKKQELMPNLKYFYDSIIKPSEDILRKNKIKNLVFIQDGSLKNLPVSALYDGQKYLIEKYSVSLAPSLQLIDPQQLNPQEIEMFSGGISEARQGFEALPGVEIELKTIEKEIPTNSLLNQSFTEENINKNILKTPFEIVHLATHGVFSSNLEDTFLLTYNEKLNINELNTLLRKQTKTDRPIELLVLSACQTAVGDERAVLGLAGVAVKAGTRSTLASLWSVSDDATVLLMSTFYRELAKGNITKSEAFQRAQMAVLENENFAHPYNWSAFVLVGNWL